MSSVTWRLWRTLYRKARSVYMHILEWHSVPDLQLGSYATPGSVNIGQNSVQNYEYTVGNKEKKTGDQREMLNEKNLQFNWFENCK